MWNRSLLALVGLVILHASANGQTTTGCPSLQKTVNVSSYTLLPPDNCELVSLTANGNLSINLPPASIEFPSGRFESILYPQSGGTVTVTAQKDVNSGIKRFVNGNSSLTFLPGQAIGVRIGTDSNWYAVPYGSLVTTGTFNSGLTITKNIVSPDNSGNIAKSGYVITETASGIAPTAFSLNLVNQTSDTATLLAGSLGANTDMLYSFGGPTMTGNRTILNLYSHLTTPTGNVKNGSSYGAFAAEAFADANDNGTGVTNSTSSGQIQTENIIARAGPTATNLYQVSTGEFNTQMDVGSSAYEKIGQAIVQLTGDKVQGSVIDTAYSLANASGAVGWKTGWLWGRPDGVWPFSSGAVGITCYNPGSGCGTMATFLDLSNVTFGSNQINMPGWAVGSGGNFSIGNGTPTVPLDFGTGNIGVAGQVNVIRVYDTGVSTTSYGIGLSSGQLNLISGGALALWANGLQELTGNSNGTVSFNRITGSTQCLHVDTNGVLSGTGVDCGAGGGSATYTTVSKTANYPVVSGDSNTWFDNSGATGEVDFTLPTWVAGLHFCFGVVSAQIVKVVAPASAQIAIGVTNSAVSGNISASAPFSNVCLHAAQGPTNQWLVDASPAGTWTVQ